MNNKSIKSGCLTYKVYEDTVVIERADAEILPQHLTIPSTLTSNGETYTVTSIGEWAFSDCDELKGITIPDSVTEIGNNAFLRCKSLESITIPNSVTEIGNGAFCECISLKIVDIPNSVTEIGYGAFAGCDNLAEVNIPASDKAFPLWVRIMESKNVDPILALV